MVTDNGGAVMPGVHVKIRNLDTNIPREMKTGESGDYTITNLAPGNYELTADLPSFNSFLHKELVLQVGQVQRLDVQMRVGLVSETVEVTSQVPALNTEVGAIKGDVIVQAEIQDLPLDGRDFFDVAFLVPGVVPRAQGGQGSSLNVNGARADNTNYSVDGFNNRNPRGAAAQVRPNMDAMQEFKMEVSGYSAESGRMAGGVMNMALRSGTNQMHGSLFEYIRNDVFDARAFFDPVKQPLRRNQFGATLHGPVILPRLYKGRDRTFFLFSWESFRETLAQTNIGRVPAPRSSTY
ncbi:MAG: TonB-dependent receptor [Acidobacteriia bacterium]|nr:TonB-dependent receptor [Terriglobia bacterium]